METMRRPGRPDDGDTPEILTEREREKVEALHAFVIQGDATALNQLAERVLPVVCRMLRSRFPGAKAELVIEGAEDAFLDYSRDPGQFDRTRGTLEVFLLARAARNVLNLLEKEDRRQRRETANASDVAEDSPVIESDALAGLEQSEIREYLLRSATSEVERSAVILLLDGEYSTAALAVALSASHLSFPEQQREVKRFKDRVKKRLLRHLGKSWPVAGAVSARSVRPRKING
jgi:hypothetical protein